MKRAEGIVVAVISAIIGAVFAVVIYDVPTEKRWRVTAAQIESLGQSIAGTHGFQRVGFPIYPAPGQPEAVRLGYRIMQSFAFRNGWSVSIYPFDAENSPEETGIKIAVRQGSIPEDNPNYRTLRAIFAGAGFVTAPSSDRRLKGDGVAVIVGRTP